jgi:hypothetical protein
MKAGNGFALFVVAPIIGVLFVVFVTIGYQAGQHKRDDDMKKSTSMKNELNMATPEQVLNASVWGLITEDAHDMGR